MNPLITRLHRLSMKLIFVMARSVRLRTALLTFKMAVRIVAKRHGLHATFMPKPKAEVNGSGMHIQFSLIKDGRMCLRVRQIMENSAEAYYFIGGLLAHSKEMALITNPIVKFIQTTCSGL